LLSKCCAPGTTVGIHASEVAELDDDAHVLTASEVAELNDDNMELDVMNVGYLGNVCKRDSRYSRPVRRSAIRRKSAVPIRRMRNF